MTAPEKRKPYPPTSPQARALNVVGDKWTLLIVRALMFGAMRFVILQREGVAGISTEQLRTRLARMEADGLLTKTRYREVPPRVMYELTPKGVALAPVLEQLAAWGDEYAEAA